MTALSLLFDREAGGAAQNRLLAALPADEFDGLAPHLAETRLDAGRVLHEAEQAIRTVYFPLSGLVSLVTLGPEWHEIDTATIGREGAVGAMAALGSDIAWNRAVVQAPGRALEIAAPRLAELADRSKPLRTA